MTISDEAVEAAAKRLARHNGTGPGNWEWYANEARAILEAAAPFIRAGALEDAADDLDLPGSSASGYYASEQVSGYLEAERHVEAWLCARAAEMRQGRDAES